MSKRKDYFGKGVHPPKGSTETPDLHKAIQAACDDAAQNHAGLDTYKVDIFVEAGSPIHSYSVIVTPVD